MAQTNSLTDVRSFAPEDFRRWVLGGIALTLVGYTLITGVGIWQYGLHTNYAPRGIVVTSICALAYILAARGHEVTGGVIAILATWFEIQSGFVGNQVFPSPGLLVLPVLIIAIGLLTGARLAFVVTLLTLVATYVTHQFSPGVRHASSSAEFVYWYTLHAISMISAWVLLYLSLTGFGRVMQELTRKERDYADTIRFAPDGLLVVDENDSVVLANPAAETILDLSHDEIVGQRIGTVMQAAARSSTLDELPRDTGDSAVALRLTARNGAPVHVEVTCRRMEIGRYQLLLRNVTERVLADQHRREIELQLAHAQRLEAVGQLAGGLSHDFNNILTAVSGSAELLRSEVDPTERAALLDEILAAGDRGAGLTRQLLAFARRDVLQPRVIDLAAHVSSLQRLLQRVLGDRSRLQLELSLPTPLRVRVDPGQLEQALINLVANARDAMPSGGTCTLRASAAQLPGGESAVRLDVTDDGIGMSPEVAARAFEPFFTTKPRGQGTGLGLSSVHGMVSQSGGTARIVSRLGHGTQVTLEFPCVSDATTPVSAPTLEPVRDAERRTILLAEDDDSTRGVVERMLRQAGYHVVAATDGRDALRIVDTGHTAVDLLLTDVMMPGLTGPELADRLRERLPRLPVLFMTGYADAILESSDGRIHARHVITKPFSLHALRARLAELTNDDVANTSA